MAVSPSAMELSGEEFVVVEERATPEEFAHIRRRGSIIFRPPTSVFCGFKEFQGAEKLRQHGHSTSVSTSTLWSIFSEAATAMRKTCIVVDALDEMDLAESERFLEGLCGVGNSQTGMYQDYRNESSKSGDTECFQRINSDIAWYGAQRLKDATEIQMEEAARDASDEQSAATSKGTSKRYLRHLWPAAGKMQEGGDILHGNTFAGGAGEYPKYPAQGGGSG
ncbi:hypothetical protein BGX38DRAFT_1139723 [Terfezia claveryi]|nr:hypothetical protein BGX38DRAFT_1139723 [Terfezia claveryi]